MRSNKSVHAGIVAILLLAISILLTGCSSKENTQLIPVNSVKTDVQKNLSISIKWDGVEDGFYRIFRKDNDSADYRYICDVNGTECVDDTVSFNNSYRYRVNPINSKSMSQGTESEAVTLGYLPSKLSASVDEKGNILLTWVDTHSGNWNIYGGNGAGWTKIAESKVRNFSYENEAGYECFAVSANYSDNGVEFRETPKTEASWLLHSPVITSVTHMDKYNNAVFYTTVKDAEFYEIYRSSSPNGEYKSIGRSYDYAYYDQCESADMYYYKVRACTAISTGRLSDKAGVGLNKGTVFSVPVFMYHEFTTQKDLDEGILWDEYSIWKDEFEQDLIYLAKNGYTTITCQQLVDYLSGSGTLPKKPVLLTIDDGKYGVYKTAWPLLKQYGMTASLAVIGERIDEATNDTSVRSDKTAPYCTWDELAEMSESGNVEIISHTFYNHRYNNGSRNGANIGENESLDSFLKIAKTDFNHMENLHVEYMDNFVKAMAYPYSIRSKDSDRVWLQAGYSLLLAGDSSEVSRTHSNTFVLEGGLNNSSSVLRRLVRETGTPIGTYLDNAIEHDR